MIFKAYDIRGIVPAELDPDIAYGIGRATAHYLEADPIAVGRDARTHSPELAEALIDGKRVVSVLCGANIGSKVLARVLGGESA